MKYTLISLFFVLSMFFSVFAQADTVTLQPGMSVELKVGEPTSVVCEGFKPIEHGLPHCKLGYGSFHIDTNVYSCHIR